MRLITVGVGAHSVIKGGQIRGEGEILFGACPHLLKEAYLVKNIGDR